MAKKGLGAREGRPGGEGRGEGREGPAFSLAPEGEGAGGSEPFFIPEAKAAVSKLLDNLRDPERLEGLSARETLELTRELMKEIRLQEEHEGSGTAEAEGTSAEELTALDKRLRGELKKKGYL